MDVIKERRRVLEELKVKEQYPFNWFIEVYNRRKVKIIHFWVSKMVTQKEENI